MEDYNKAIELKSNYAKAYFNRGIAYDETHQKEKAIVDYSKAIELKSDYAKAYLNRGIAYGDIGENKKAIG
ncbi:MAG: tetratricopeptide repeat protein, partial [Oscillospiraceae bacterium]|nr:tetratricopeptide repeat protein [Oscillospiraceae bacterium]